MAANTTKGRLMVMEDHDLFKEVFYGTATNGHCDDLISLDDLLDSPEEPFNWLVPGLIEEMDRIILTGLEGGGKSTFCRQIGAQVAIGVHPFGGPPFEPIEVLYIDCENSRNQVRRKADILRKRRGALLAFKFRPDGVDLTIVAHIAWLEQQIRQAMPRLVIIGPIYKMAGGDPKDEQNAKAVASVLDDLRVRYNFALIIEAHSPYADGSKSKRPERPYGASLWSRWPEFGIHLANDGALRHWRGPRDEREWPTKLKRGETWPWEVEVGADVDDVGWEGPTKCMASVRDFFRTTGTAEYSGNQLYTSMKTIGAPYHRATIGQAAERLVMDGHLSVRTGARNSRLYSNCANPTQQSTDHGRSPNDDEF